MQSKSPVSDPRWLPNLALAGLRSNCGEWYENDARGGVAIWEITQDTEKVRKVNTGFVVTTEKESGHQDAGKDDTEPNSQVHMEQPLGNADEVSQDAIFQNAGTQSTAGMF